MRMQFAAVCATACALGVSGNALAERPMSPEQPQSPKQQPPQQRSEQSGSSIQDEDVQRTVGSEVVSFEQLSLEQKKNLQQRLNEEGHYNGDIDGVIGPRTVTALEEYKAQEGLGGGSALTPETVERLGLDIDVDETRPVRGTQQKTQSESAAGSQQGAMPGEPAGRSQAPGQQGVQQQARTQAPQVETIDLSQLQAEQVRQLQESLQAAGYFRGEVDGRAGPLTRSALRRYFEQRAKLAEQGRIPADAAEDMGLSVDEIQPVRGAEEAEGAPERQTAPEPRPDEPGAGTSPGQPGREQAPPPTERPEQEQPMEPMEPQEPPMQHPMD